MENAKHDKQIQQFFNFINERHRIYVRRFELGENAPWTQDPILAKYKFCNVYRELDRGTIWYKDYFTFNSFINCSNECELLFKTFVYRLVNTIEIFDHLGIPGIYEISHFIENLKKLKNQNNIKFNPAYRIFGTFGRGEGDAISELEKSLNDIKNNIDFIHQELKTARNMEEAWKALQNAYRIGPFIAYEIICDLILIKFVPWTENDFVNVGPGALLGLKIIFEEDFNKNSPEDQIIYLANNQWHYLPADYPGKDLSLRSIEHSLCEYRKYYNLKNSKSHGRLFIPRKISNANTLF